MRASVRPNRFLSADAVLFASLFAGYVYLRAISPTWPRPFHFPSSLMTIAMLMAAGAASFVIRPAARAARAGDASLAQRLLAISVVLWLSFLFLLAIEWARLYLAEGVHFLTNPWHVAGLGATYYLLSGFQALHALAASVWSASRAQYPKTGGLEPLVLFTYLTTAQFALIAFGLIFASADLQGF